MTELSPAARACRGAGYGLHSHARMTADSLRRRAYLDALAAAVRPGDVVLEIGTGCGLFALDAARRGARHVYAIEPDEVIQLARDLARANALDDRITFVQQLSTTVALPERADVLVWDLRGVLPLFAGHLPAVADARARLLKPGARLINQQDTICAALVDGAAAYADQVEIWRQALAGLEAAPARALAVNATNRCTMGGEQLRSEVQVWARLDYRGTLPARISGMLTWQLAHAATLHGVLLWFVGELYGGYTLSNAPGQPSMVYGQLFLPLERPLDVAAGDEVRVQLDAIDLGPRYVWRWQTTHRPLGGGPPQAFDQSTFHGEALTPESLHEARAPTSDERR